jgi:hypothetical protein
VLLTLLTVVICVQSSTLEIMVFTPPSWVPKLPHSKYAIIEAYTSYCRPTTLQKLKKTFTGPPDTVPIYQFMLNEEHGRHPMDKSQNPFTCGISGRTFSMNEMVIRVEHLARALSKELGWEPNRGTEWDKVAGIFALNTVGCIGLIEHSDLAEDF